MGDIIDKMRRGMETSMGAPPSWCRLAINEIESLRAENEKLMGLKKAVKRYIEADWGSEEEKEAGLAMAGMVDDLEAAEAAKESE